MESSSIRKYLLYALGEIALVVIGILIALQVNAWKENRDEQRIFKSNLEELHNDFLTNVNLIKQAIAQLEGTKRAARNIVSFIETGYAVKDTSFLIYNPGVNMNAYRNDSIPVMDTLTLLYNLDRVGFLTNFDLFLPAWEQIVNTGQIDLLNGTQLTNSIAQLMYYATETEELEANIYIPVVKEFQAVRPEYVDVSKSIFGMPHPGLNPNEQVWIDIEKIMSDEQFVFHLRKIFRSANEHQGQIEEMMTLYCNPVIELLSKELNIHTR